MEFLYRLFPYLHSIGVVKQPFYQYIQREGAITATFDRRLFDYLKNWETILDSYRQCGLLEKYRPELQYSCMRYLYATFLKGVAVRRTLMFSGMLIGKPELLCANIFLMLFAILISTTPAPRESIC